VSALFEAEGAGYAAGGRMLVREAGLALEPGRVVAIVGPNGAGKTTLMKLMTGELAPHAGAIRSLGAPLGRIPAWRLACRRAVMAQSTRLAFPFAVHEVVRLGIEGLGRARAPEAALSLVAEALERADALALAGRDYQTLSGGEQQRVQFARALCQLRAGASVEAAQALFLDEPIASLDLCHQLALLDAARDLARHAPVAVLAILHDLNLAAHYADHLVVMDQGAIVAAGPPAAVLDPALLRRVFRVAMAMPAGPPPMPFVLPQFCRPVA
jgi:iron complex transport system ATP-binding protein